MVCIVGCLKATDIVIKPRVVVLNANKVNSMSKTDIGKMRYTVIQLVNSYNLVTSMSKSLFDTRLIGLQNNVEDVNKDILELMYIWKNSAYDEALRESNGRVEYLVNSVGTSSELGKCLGYMYDAYKDILNMTIQPSMDIKSEYIEVSKRMDDFNRAYNEIGKYIKDAEGIEIEVPKLEYAEFEYASGVPKEEYPVGGLCGMSKSLNHTVEHMSIQTQFMNRLYDEIKDTAKSMEDVKKIIDVAYDAWWASCSKSSVSNSIQTNYNLIHILLMDDKDIANKAEYSLLCATVESIEIYESQIKKTNFNSVDEYLENLVEVRDTANEKVTNTVKVIIGDN